MSHCKNGVYDSPLLPQLGSHQCEPKHNSLLPLFNSNRFIFVKVSYIVLHIWHLEQKIGAVFGRDGEIYSDLKCQLEDREKQDQQTTHVYPSQ